MSQSTNPKSFKMPNKRVLVRDALIFARCPQPVDVCDERGTTPLMMAAAVGALVSVQLFLQVGANSTRPNCLGETPLMMAAASQEEGSEEVVTALLNAGADANDRDNEGNGLCSYANSVSKLRALQEAGLDLDQILNTHSSTRPCTLLQHLMLRLVPQTSQTTTTIMPMLQGLCALLPTNALNRVDEAGRTVLDVANMQSHTVSTPCLNRMIETLKCAGARQRHSSSVEWWGAGNKHHT